MTAPALDPAVLRVVDSYRTCEFATVNREGVPVTWPAVTVRRPDGTFLLTTSIALPQKAFNVRRDPRVALLFSDPTGSGLDGAPQVLVQGTAHCPDEVHAGTAGAEDYWAQLAVRQPSSRANRSNAAARWFLDWYHMRLHITVTPTAVLTRPAAPAGPTAVLGVGDPAGPPRLLRVPAEPTADGHRLVVPDGDVPTGPASLLVHAHNEQLAGLSAVLAFGDLGPGGAFTARRQVQVGGGGPLDTARVVLGLRRAAAAYLRRRGLPRPAIAWDEFAAADRG